MTRPRSEIISLSDTCYYHCVSRCVRRAFLCGDDHYSGRCYEHRRDWLEQKLLETASVFAIKICAYAVMSNHYHVVLHVRPDLVEQWSDYEVVERWHRLYCGTPISSRFLSNSPLSKADQRTLTSLVREWRARLTSISWFMRIVNEHIARQANAEDDCTGRFWEGRFKSQALLDESAVLSCMAYVDLNPIRANLATSPERSDFTSVQHRIRAIEEFKPTHNSLESFTGVMAGSTGIPCKLSDYLALVDWTAKRVQQSEPNSAISQPKLVGLNLDTTLWLHASTKFGLHRGLKISAETLQARFNERMRPPPPTR